MTAALRRMTVERRTQFDEYRGSAEDLIAAGLVKLEQLPGTPGQPRCSVTYYRGERVPYRQGRKTVDTDEHYLNIVRTGNTRYCVRIGLPAEERQRRQRELAAKLRAEQVARPAHAGSAPGPQDIPTFRGYIPELHRRLAAIESLCRYARAGVRLKMDQSSKLARADDDLTQAIAALADARTRFCATSIDSLAMQMLVCGEAAEQSYLQCARK